MQALSKLLKFNSDGATNCHRKMSITKDEQTRLKSVENYMMHDESMRQYSIETYNDFLSTVLVNEKNASKFLTEKLHFDSKRVEDVLILIKRLKND
jgi:hypothetical protein